MALSKKKSEEVEEFIWYNMMDESGNIVLSPNPNDDIDFLINNTNIGLADAEQIVKLIRHDWSKYKMPYN